MTAGNFQSNSTEDNEDDHESPCHSTPRFPLETPSRGTCKNAPVSRQAEGRERERAVRVNGKNKKKLAGWLPFQPRGRSSEAVNLEHRLLRLAVAAGVEGSVSSAADHRERPPPNVPPTQRQVQSTMRIETRVHSTLCCVVIRNGAHKHTHTRSSGEGKKHRPTISSTIGNLKRDEGRK